MQKRGEGVKKACKNAYVINGRPLSNSRNTVVMSHVTICLTVNPTVRVPIIKGLTSHVKYRKRPCRPVELKGQGSLAARWGERGIGKGRGACGKAAIVGHCLSSDYRIH